MDYAKSLDGFSKRLRCHMIMNDVTYSMLAEWLEVPSGTVWNWTHGRHFPRIPELIGICKTLRVSADYLLLGDGDD